MKILIDENLPIKLKQCLLEFDVFTVRDMFWDGLTNGELLHESVQKGFQILITSDKNLQYQQNIEKIGIAVVVLNVKFLKWKNIEPLIPKIINLIPEIVKGKIYVISE